MAAAGSTALADKPGRGGPVETFDDNSAAIFANSQDDRDTPAAQMTGWWGRFFNTLQETLKELPQDLHVDNMNKIDSECNV